MSAHTLWTPEPWKEEEGPITLGGKQYSLLAFPFDYGRARQCVNACEGIPGAILSKGAGSVAPSITLIACTDEIQTLRAQRDELLAALKRALARVSNEEILAVSEATKDAMRGIANDIRAAIAKAGAA